MTRRALLLPALVLALSACSGDDGGSGTATAPQSPSAAEVREAFVEQATSICEQADRRFTELAAPTTPEDFAPFVRDTTSIAEQAQNDLEALTPPEPDRAELQERVLEPFAALVDDAKAFTEKVTAAGTDQEQLLPLLGERPTSADIDLEYLRSYGLDVCADAIGRAG